MNIPEYRIEEDFEEAYVGWFMRDGLSLLAAKQEVTEAIQEHAAAGFRASLLASIAYYARMYAKMYPERMKPVARKRKTFTLRGYKPEVMQTVHVPGYQKGGHTALAKRILMEMEEGE